MINQQVVNEAKNRLVKTYAPLEIYLFGSYAWGKPTVESDLDFLVVIETAPQNRHTFHVQGYRALRDLNAPKDIVIFTKREFEEHAADVSSLCHKIKKEGMLIYAKA